MHSAGGYLYQNERFTELQEGMEPFLLGEAYRNSFPEFNVQADPMGVLTQEDQGQQGSCVGNSGTSVVESCYFLATGRKIQLSRACGYYESQRHDGINGDRGATLAGFRKVALSGICLESDWPYPSRYDNRRPVGIQDKMVYRVKATRPLQTIDEFDFWVIESKLPVHAGLGWNNSTDREYVTDYNGGGGGHAVMFWQMVGQDYRMINSWGSRWQGKGWNRWSRKAIATCLKHQWTVMIGYAPDDMTHPNPEPLT